MSNSTMYNSSTLAMLYIREMSIYHNPRNGRDIPNFSYGTWCVGIEMNKKLYVKQVSLDNILGANEVLCIRTAVCEPYTHAPTYSDFKAFAFDVEADKIISECHEAEIIFVDDLDSDIHEALQSAIEMFENVRIGA